jgi:hypothetical protein
MAFGSAAASVASIAPLPRVYAFPVTQEAINAYRIRILAGLEKPIPFTGVKAPWDVAEAPETKPFRSIFGLWIDPTE